MKLASKKTGRALSLLASALAISAVAGCFALGVGRDPPTNQLYYPTGVITSPGGHTLYVVNSDFDIQYTGGTVQALDLDALRKCVTRLDKNLNDGTWKNLSDLCDDVGLGVNPETALVPGPCGHIRIAEPVDDGKGGQMVIACKLSDDPDTTEVEDIVTGKGNQIIQSSPIIGAFASAATLVQNASPVDDASPGCKPAARLFVTVRGDPSVTYFDTTDDARDPGCDPFRLDCNAGYTQALGPNACGNTSRIGVSQSQSPRLLTLPVEPTGIAVSDDGKAIVVVHQTGGANSRTHGQASVLINRWTTPGPSLEFTVTGLPDNPDAVVSVPTSAYVKALRAKSKDMVKDYRPGFLVAYHSAAEIDLLRYFDDIEGTARSFIQRVSAFGIATNSGGTDSRGIAINDWDRKQCEAACQSDNLPCLKACVDVPLEVYVTNRTPASLLFGKLKTELAEEDGVVTGVSDTVNMSDMIPLATGPSRLAVGRVLDAQGHAVPRIFAVAFDSRYVVIYDPLQRRVEAALRTGRGPHALGFDIAEKTATDPGHAYLYVAHFTDSYLGVVDLDTRNTRTYGSMFGAIGQPTAPKESK